MSAPLTNAAALKMVAAPLHSKGEETYQEWLDWADSQLATEAEGWGAQRTVAVALLAAHLWLRLTGGNVAGLAPTSAQVSGVVSGEAAADRSRSYAPIATTTIEQAELASTVYGAQFLRLRASRPAFGARMIRVPVS